jgi:polyisoprenoid-binding protein YceI
MGQYVTSLPAHAPGRSTAGAFALIALLFAAPASGVQVDNGNGRVMFTATQSEVQIDGEFMKFTGDVDFNPAKPNAGKVVITIDVASVATGSSEADDLLKEKDFFDAKRFPRASFTSEEITSAGAAQFQVRGNFALKGRSTELIIPFTAYPEAAGFRIEGHMPLSRRAYRVGEGQWADTGTLADDVQIRFVLHIPRRSAAVPSLSPTAVP